MTAATTTRTDQMVRTPGGVALHAHAVEQMLARDVTPAEVDLVLTDADLSYDCHRSRDPRRVHQRGDLAVVVGADGVVVTVLYRLQAQWTSEQGRPSGRRMSRLARRRLLAELRRIGGTA